MGDNNFHPHKSKVNESRFGDFMNCQLTGDLTEIPGIGPATVEILKNCKLVHNQPDGSEITVNGITSTFGLIGAYLSLKSDVDEDGNVREVGPVEHADRFYHWWCQLGTPAGFRAGVVHCICEKTNVAFPGIYDAEAYSELPP